MNINDVLNPESLDKLQSELFQKLEPLYQSCDGLTNETLLTDYVSRGAHQNPFLIVVDGNKTFFITPNSQKRGGTFTEAFKFNYRSAETFIYENQPELLQENANETIRLGVTLYLYSYKRVNKKINENELKRKNLVGLIQNIGNRNVLIKKFKELTNGHELPNLYWYDSTRIRLSSSKPHS